MLNNYIYTGSTIAFQTLNTWNQANSDHPKFDEIVALVTGGDLEEAAKLIKFQQSYQAAAQIISTANLLFDTLISAVR